VRGSVLAWPRPKGFGQNRRIESGPSSQLVALPSKAAFSPRAGMMLHCSN
jgi:hypothetical protein